MNKVLTQLKRHKLMALCLVLLCMVQLLNFTGFCYSEFRYVGKRELVDRYLFGEGASDLTDQQKKEALKARGAEYPNCCKIDRDPWWISKSSQVINKFFGRYFYEIEFNYLRKNPPEKDSPYFQEMAALNACGTNSIGKTGISKNKKHYDLNINLIQKYWDGEQ